MRAPVCPCACESAGFLCAQPHTLWSPGWSRVSGMGWGEHILSLVSRTHSILPVGNTFFSSYREHILFLETMMLLLPLLVPVSAFCRMPYKCNVKTDAYMRCDHFQKKAQARPLRWCFSLAFSLKIAFLYIHVHVLIFYSYSIHRACGPALVSCSYV